MSIRSIRHWLEYALARLALAVIPRLPRRVVVRLARLLGAAAALAAPEMRKIAQANLDIAFGSSRTDAEKRRIVRRSFQSFALVMLDVFWFARDSAKRTNEWVVFDASMERLFRPATQICVTAHMGNWEVLGMAFSARGFPLVSVAAPLANRKLDRLFVELRHRTGQQILSKHGAVRGLLKTLKSGGKIALVLDQNTKPSVGGIFVDFFGLPAPVSPAAATLALRTGAEIFTGVCLPDADGRYFVPRPEQVEFAPASSELDVTVSVVRSIERLLLAHPEHWLWMYKRWKYIAPERTSAEYPFYAKAMARKDLDAALAARPQT